MTPSKAKQLAQQAAVTEYLGRWGIRVVRGGFDDGKWARGLMVRTTVPPRRALREAGLYMPDFNPNGSLLRSCVDVPRRTVYWPADACEPYFLLHEGVHLLMALATGVPVNHQDEHGPMAAVEYFSAWALERAGTGVTRCGWRGWRWKTGDKDFETPSSLAHYTATWREWCLDGLLFVERGRGAPPEPTYWLPNGDVKASEVE